MENFRNFSVVDGECGNFSTSSFNATFSRMKNQLLVMNLNIQSFGSKYVEFSTFLDEISLKRPILVLTETWFNSSTGKEILGYKSFHCTRSGDVHRGGISVFVLETLNLSCLHFSCRVTDDLEHVRIILKPNNENRKNIEIVGFYRPPYRTRIDDFFNSLESILNNLGANNDQILIGDFNICGLVRNPLLENYLDIKVWYAVTFLLPI